MCMNGSVRMHKTMYACSYKQDSFMWQTSISCSKKILARMGASVETLMAAQKAFWKAFQKAFQKAEGLLEGLPELHSASPFGRPPKT